VLTKANKRREAERIAEAFEDVGARSSTIRQLKATVAELHKAISNEDHFSLTVKEESMNWLASKRGEVSSKTLAKYTADITQFLQFMCERARLCGQIE
jgi:hypothetical protein